MRLFNNTKAPLPTAQAVGEVRVEPGQVGEFNVENPSVKLWIAHRWLIAEGEVLASQSATLSGAPTVGAMAQLRDELSKRDIVIEDLRQRDASRVAEMKRIEERFAELAASHGSSDALVAENDALKAKVADLDSMVATLTAPAASDAAASGKPKSKG